MIKRAAKVYNNIILLNGQDIRRLFPCGRTKVEKEENKMMDIQHTIQRSSDLHIEHLDIVFGL